MRILRAQLHALWSVPATRWLALAVVTTGVGYSALAAGAHPGVDASVWVGAGEGFAALLFALAAAAATAGTWTTGMVRTELLAVPRREVLFGAQAAAVALSGVLLGTVTAVLAAAATGFPSGCGRVVLLGGLVHAAYGLFGFGAGALLRRTAPTVVAVLLLCLLLPLVTLGATVAGLDVATLTLMQSSAFLLGGVGDPGACVLATGLWAVVPAAVAGLRFRSTDA